LKQFHEYIALVAKGVVIVEGTCDIMTGVYGKNFRIRQTEVRLAFRK